MKKIKKNLLRLSASIFLFSTLFLTTGCAEDKQFFDPVSEELPTNQKNVNNEDSQSEDENSQATRGQASALLATILADDDSQTDNQTQQQIDTTTNTINSTALVPITAEVIPVA